MPQTKSARSKFNLWALIDSPKIVEVLVNMNIVNYDEIEHVKIQGHFKIGNGKFDYISKNNTYTCLSLVPNKKFSMLRIEDDDNYFFNNDSNCKIYTYDMFQLIDYIAILLGLNIIAINDTSYRRLSSCDWDFRVMNKLFKLNSYFELYGFKYNEKWDVNKTQELNIPETWFSGEINDWLLSKKLTPRNTLVELISTLHTDCNKPNQSGIHHVKTNIKEKIETLIPGFNGNEMTKLTPKYKVEATLTFKHDKLILFMKQGVNTHSVTQAFKRKFIKRRTIKERLQPESLELQLLHTLAYADPSECGKLAPLVRPLSGVILMMLCELGNKKILLIGERHMKVSINKSFPPITDVIIPFLENGDKIDFMVEHFNVYYKSMGPVAKRKQYVDTLDDTVINKLRVLLSPYIFGEKLDNTYVRYENFDSSRVHWLDRTFTYEEGTPPWLMHLQTCSYKYIDKRPSFEECDSSVLQENILIPAAKMTSPEFARYMVNLIAFLPDFIKCNKRNNFIRGSFEALFAHNHLTRFQPGNTDFLLFNFRLIMDMYTVCKLLKTDTSGWYTNTVIYAGMNHTLHVAKMLHENGFTVRKVNVQGDPIATA